MHSVYRKFIWIVLFMFVVAGPVYAQRGGGSRGGGGGNRGGGGSHAGGGGGQPRGGGQGGRTRGGGSAGSGAGRSAPQGQGRVGPSQGQRRATPPLVGRSSQPQGQMRSAPRGGYATPRSPNSRPNPYQYRDYGYRQPYNRYGQGLYRSYPYSGWGSPYYGSDYSCGYWAYDPYGRPYWVTSYCNNGFGGLGFGFSFGRRWPY